MSADLEKLAAQFKGDQFKSIRDVLVAQAQQARLLGAPEYFSTRKTTRVGQVVSEEIGATEVRRFPSEAREALEKEGYLIYELTGRTIRSFRESERRWSGRKYLDFETQSSMYSQVAVNPQQLFLEGSNNISFEEQKGLISRFSDDFNKKVQGVDAIMGEAADYIELAFAHLDTTGQELFGEKFNNLYIRTKTLVGGDIAYVGDYLGGDGLDVSGWGGSHAVHNLLAVPLVVPA